jgi:hypothetical protein
LANLPNAEEGCGGNGIGTRSTNFERRSPPHAFIKIERYMYIN